MKRLIVLIVVAASVFIFVGCTNTGTDALDDAGNGIRIDVDIGERFFVNQMFEIFLNYRQYLGNTIRYEGMFHTIQWGGDEFHVVFRYMLGCCGEEEILGFEVMLNDTDPFPDDTWVEVIGELDQDDGFLIVRVISITEMDQRGEAFVS